MSTTEPIRNKTDLQKFMDYYAAIQPNPRNQALILLGLYTALRIGDILQLNWRMVYDLSLIHISSIVPSCIPINLSFSGSALIPSSSSSSRTADSR